MSSTVPETKVPEITGWPSDQRTDADLAEDREPGRIELGDHNKSAICESMTLVGGGETWSESAKVQQI
jgi:hypothetical protein